MPVQFDYDKIRKLNVNGDARDILGFAIIQALLFGVDEGADLDDLMESLAFALDQLEYFDDTRHQAGATSAEAVLVLKETFTVLASTLGIVRD